mmetsp:Transcript_27332/g.61784  ORF Transcript_27332/g.61784 Transcript_27332/m.61784 type:complete len:225 (+) Transcript_27332:682-1356(+)
MCRLSEQIVARRRRHLACGAAQLRVTSEQLGQRCARIGREAVLAVGACWLGDHLAQRCSPLCGQAVGASESRRCMMVVCLHRIKRALVHTFVDEAHVRRPENEVRVGELLEHSMRRLVLVRRKLQLRILVTLTVLDEDGRREQMGHVEKPVVNHLALVAPAHVRTLFRLALDRAQRYLLEHRIHGLRSHLAPAERRMELPTSSHLLVRRSVDRAPTWVARRGHG